jgi:hypothetical protein
MVMLHGHHAAARTVRGSNQNAWVIFGKQGWVSSRERRRDYSSIRKEGVSYPELASVICGKHSEKNDVPFAASLHDLKQAIADLTSWYPTEAQRDRYSKYIEPLNPSWIITTNYDLVLESLLTGKSVPLGPNDSLLARQGVVPVFHLHGVRSNPEDIIIAQEDYVALFRPTEYRQIKLALTIKESSTLLLGYGLGDVNVLTALDWSRNVFKGREGTYPSDVIQVLRRCHPKDAPYRDKNGIAIIETAEIAEFFEEFGVIRSKMLQKEKDEKATLEKVVKQLRSPKDTEIAKFIDDVDHRRTILKALSKFPIDLVAGFMSFLNKCIDETWKRAEPSGAFHAYDQGLTLLLDLAVALPVESFPPALFQTVAYNLNRVAYFVGDTLGKSRSAARTWRERKSEVPSDVVRELRNIAEQYRYMGLAELLDS